MPLSMSQASVPVIVQQLTTLSAILTKAESFAETQNKAPSDLIDARLADDMFPLARQIQIATDGAKGGVARLAGVEVPSYPDTETSFAELQARIAKTIAFVKSIPADKIDGSEDKPITLKVGPNEMTFTGQPYLLHFVLPNFFFHVTTAYGILRQAGVEIGKRDYLGEF